MKRPGLLLITNNPMVKEKMGDSFAISFVDGGYGDVLIKVRDMVHIGHGLYTHPLAGSIKPNQTPYRTVAVSEKADEFSMEYSEIISNSIAVWERFAGQRRFSHGVLKDLQAVDMSLIEGALEAGPGAWYAKAY